MIHDLTLGTICSLGEFLGQGEEGSFPSCIPVPSKIYGKASSKPQNSGTNGNTAGIIPRMFWCQWTLSTVTIACDVLSFALSMV